VPAEILDEATLLTEDIVTQFGQPPYRIDLLNAIDGVTFAEVRSLSWSGARDLGSGRPPRSSPELPSMRRTSRCPQRRRFPPRDFTTHDRTHDRTAGFGISVASRRWAALLLQIVEVDSLAPCVRQILDRPRLNFLSREAIDDRAKLQSNVSTVESSQARRCGTRQSPTYAARIDACSRSDLGASYRCAASICVALRPAKGDLPVSR